jgi:hypothetical protein
MIAFAVWTTFAITSVQIKRDPDLTDIRVIGVPMDRQQPWQRRKPASGAREQDAMIHTLNHLYDLVLETGKDPACAAEGTLNASRRAP